MQEITGNNTPEITSEVSSFPSVSPDIPVESGEDFSSPQEFVEDYHRQSIDRILETNGKYMSEDDRIRVSNGVDNIWTARYDPESGYTGYYLYKNGSSKIEVSIIDRDQMERTVIHETNHFASKNNETYVSQPEKNGYTVYRTVGTRETSWFHSSETGADTDFSSKGEGLNEGLTTMYTNRQLTELSEEKGLAAERQEIYWHSTELCKQLEDLVGEDILKKAYYGGDIESLRSRVDELAGENGYESLRDCMDRTISKDRIERVKAMREAQDILAEMYEKKGTDHD